MSVPSEVDNQFKDAANRYCTIIGEDPDELVSYPDPNGYAVARKTSRRALVMLELVEFAAKMKALHEAGIWWVGPR